MKWFRGLRNTLRYFVVYIAGIVLFIQPPASWSFVCIGRTIRRHRVLFFAPIGAGDDQAQHLAMVKPGIGGVFHDQGCPASGAAPAKGDQLFKRGPGPAEKMVGQLPVR